MVYNRSAHLSFKLMKLNGCKYMCNLSVSQIYF